MSGPARGTIRASANLLISTIIHQLGWGTYLRIFLKKILKTKKKLRVLVFIDSALSLLITWICFFNTNKAWFEGDAKLG